jgi:CBS domain-containing protein
MSQPISSLMHREVQTFDMDTTIADVERALVERRLSWAPVRGDGGGILGVISAPDVARFHAEGRDAAASKAWQLCTYKPITARPDESLQDVARRMVDHHVHHVVVVEKGGVVGVVSALDIVRLVASGQAGAG